jgi:hypothetical protein
MATNPQLPIEFKTFLEWKAIVVDTFSGLDGVKATIIVSPATNKGDRLLFDIISDSFTK